MDEALSGAQDIVAEMISDDAALRKKLRGLIRENGDVVSRAQTKDSTVYDMYSDFSAPVAKLVPHRVLALNRGDKEKILSVKIDMYEPSAIAMVLRHILKKGAPGQYLQAAAEDAYKRLIFPSIEREIRGELTELAEEQAIKVFGENLKNLLLQPPVKGKTVLALDPGFRTGNKTAVVDATGRVLDTGVVYMTLEYHDIQKANKYIETLIRKHSVDIIAIGNGTASKETEMAVAALIKKIDRQVVYMIVNEAGASVYSASKLGAEEFPGLRCCTAQRGVDRKAAAGPAGRACQDRPESDRCGAVSARCQSETAGGDVGRRRGGLCESGWNRSEYGFAFAAEVYRGHLIRGSKEYCGDARERRAVHQQTAAEESTEAG